MALLATMALHLDLALQGKETRADRAIAMLEVAEVAQGLLAQLQGLLAAEDLEMLVLAEQEVQQLLLVRQST